MAKKSQNQPKIVYFQDELNDDFAGTKINTKKLDSNFKYTHKSHVWTFFANMLYYIFVIPFVWIYIRVILRVKFENKKVLKEFKKKKIRYYMYGNHTSYGVDAFVPNLLSLPTRNKIITNPDSVSIKGIGTIVQMLGAVPIPTGTDGLRDFVKAIDYYHTRYNITIYPEAHIWPFHTGVRNFPNTSFLYPTKQTAPVIALFTSYSKPNGLFSCFRKANITVYLSDPIYPNSNLPRKEAQEELRDKVYNFMLECSKKYNTHTVVEYKHISEKTDMEGK